MSNPTTKSQGTGKPTADDLAGTPVSREEDGPTIGVHPSAGTSSGRADSGSPSADDLAGIAVAAEGTEDLTVRPRQPRP